MMFARDSFISNTVCDTGDPVVEALPSNLENSQPISTATESRSNG